MQKKKRKDNSTIRNIIKDGQLARVLECRKKKKRKDNSTTRNIIKDGQLAVF